MCICYAHRVRLPFEIFYYRCIWRSSTAKINWRKRKTQPNAKHTLTRTFKYPLLKRSMYKCIHGIGISFIHVGPIRNLHQILNNKQFSEHQPSAVIIYSSNAFERCSGFHSIHYYYYCWGSMVLISLFFILRHIHFLFTWNLNGKFTKESLLLHTILNPWQIHWISITVSYQSTRNPKLPTKYS